MNDLYLTWGGDLEVDSSGDLAIATGSDSVSQRVCRRLLTNLGDYIWNLDYGGGLAQFVGLTSDIAGIEGVVRTQLALEASVPTTPPPTVSVRVADAANGYVVASISYADPSSATSVQLNVSIG